MSTQSGDLIRDCTPAEEEMLYERKQCPFCGHTEFIEGPSGGMATNIYCANEVCDARFNFCYPMTPQVIRESKLPTHYSPDTDGTGKEIVIRTSDRPIIDVEPKPDHRPSRGFSTGLVTGAWLFMVWAVFETIRLHEWRTLIPVIFFAAPLAFATWNGWKYRHRKGSWKSFTWGFAGGTSLIVGIAVMDLLWRIWHGQIFGG